MFSSVLAACGRFVESFRPITMNSLCLVAFLFSLGENVFGLQPVMKVLIDSPLDLNLPIDDANISIICVFNQTLNPTDEVWIEGYDETSAVLNKYAMDKDNSWSFFGSLNNLAFGNYSCGWRSASENESYFSDDVFRHNYRLCEGSKSCSQCKKTNTWCRTVPGATECFSMWDTEVYQCPKTDFLWCPLQAKSLCEGIEKHKAETWRFMKARYENIEVCPNGSDAQITYGGRVIRFDEPFSVNAENPFLNVTMPLEINRAIMIRANYSIFEESHLISNGSLRGGADTISLEELLEHKGSAAFSFVLDALYSKEGQSDIKLRMRNTPVFIANPYIATLPIGQKVHIKCGTESKQSFSDAFVILNRTRYWSVGNKNSTEGTLRFEKNTNASKEEIICHVTSYFKTCTPVSILSAYGRQKFLQPPASPTESGQKQPKKEKQEVKQKKYDWNTVGAIIGGVLLGLLLSCGIALGAYYLYTKRQKRRYPVLEATYKEPGVMDLAEVRQTAKDVTESNDAAAKLIDQVVDANLKREELLAAEKVTVAQCRHPEIPVRSSNQVIPEKGNAGLHMSKLKDLYSQPVFLAQRPTKKEFEKYLTAIWNERIGTVVISDESAVGQSSKWDECFSSHDGGRTKIGNFSLVTEVSLKSGEIDHFAVELSLNKSKGLLRRTAKRQITFIRVQTSVTPAKSVEVIEMAQESQDKRIAERLPGVLFQCPTGIHHSAALLTGFIGSQMWVQHKRINMIALLRYVRRHRYGVFSATDGIPWLRHAFSIMHIVATGTEIGNVHGLEIEAHERDVFDHTARQKELEQSARTMQMA